MVLVNLKEHKKFTLNFDYATTLFLFFLVSLFTHGVPRTPLLTRFLDLSFIRVNTVDAW